MKKNLVKMFAAFFFCGMVTTILASCSKSDEPASSGETPSPTIDNSIAKAEATYKLTFSDGIKASLNKAVDLKVEYYDGTGTLVTKTYTGAADDFSTTVNLSTIPTKCGMRVTASPKADLSGVGDDEAFNMVYSVEINVKALNSNGGLVESRAGAGGCKQTDMLIKAMAADKDDFSVFETKLYYKVSKDGIEFEK